ncbi:helix-turn-helix domain-containing protein [Aequorivita aurantiaca]|uniref:helix-turn-helix domain-containing protein n=1 Tax=Aequorivita aurantiaca TaxID=3053356 RepID=UPI00338E394D
MLEYYGLSATAFAEKINFNRSTISHLLSGRNKPSLDFVMKMLQNFDEVEMNWLLFGKGTFPSINENKGKSITPKSKDEVSGKIPMDLFSEQNIKEQSKAVYTDRNLKSIERIVIFYKDGSFNVYQN